MSCCAAIKELLHKGGSPHFYKWREDVTEDNCIDTLGLFSENDKLAEMPHCDTLNYYMERLSVSALSDLRKKMVKSLLRRKQFYRWRLLGRNWRVILDGTGLFCFKERHCANCLCTKQKDQDGKERKLYYHKVLEAKLVLGDHIVISLGTEFIENEKEDAAKQDCEINAAKRLLERLKKEYPRLPICLQGDALYAVEPIMEICRENGWEYIFTHKDTRQKTVGKDYKDLGEEDRITVKAIGKECGTGRFYNHMERLSGKKEVMNMYEYTYTEGKEARKFQWVTSLELTKKNLKR